jgi:hypothetical protein
MMKQDGQSTIEFILTFVFGLGIVFLFVNVAINYSAGYLVHYATFMGARTYLSTESHSSTEASTETAARNAALATFARFRVGTLGVPATSVLPGGNNGAPGFHINPYIGLADPKDILYVGAYAVFQRQMSFLPIVGGGDPAVYVSEAFLGKEPSRLECWKRTCSAIMLGISGAAAECPNPSVFDFTVFDNGC